MISFFCPDCGLKLQVKPEFAGRSSRCPTCKRPLVVPAASLTQADIAAGPIDGTDSSLAKAGVDGGVTLEQAVNARPGQKSVHELLSQRTRTDGRYIVAEEIARGGMGTILRAVDCDIRREVAVKYLLDQTNAQKKARFVEEAQITGQLEHPNIVPIHELGVDKQKRLFFAMKMVKGKSLAQVLDELRQGPKTAEKDYSLGQLLNILVDVCNALAYAHSRQVVHRDLKPANIMLGDFGEVYVMDWGLAKVVPGVGQVPGAVAPAATLALPTQSGTGCGSRASKVVTSREPEADLTQEGTVLGTPVYMPPEQATGNLMAIDQRSDVYSLGAILYEMLALQPPVEKEGGYLAILMRVMQGEIVPPEQRNSGRAGKIPKELSAIAMKALAKAPQDRYATVEALRRDIERFQEGRSVSAKEDSLREVVWKLVKRNRAVSAITAVGLMTLLVVLGFTFKNYFAFLKQQQRTREAVPALLRAGQLAVNDRKFKDALDQATVAVDYDPDNADAHLFRGQLLIVEEQQFPQAQIELEQCLRLRPGDKMADKLMKLCQQAKAGDPTIYLEFADLFTQQKEHGLADGVMRRFGEDDVEARKRLFEMYRKRFESAPDEVKNGFRLSEGGKFSLRVRRGQPMDDTTLALLKGIPLTSIEIENCEKVRDLSPLKGNHLTSLSLGQCAKVTDLSPLKETPLTALSLINFSQLSDLSPLKGMQLTSLSLFGCGQVSDLSPLKGMPLQSLSLTTERVLDLSPLKGMPLTTLNLYRCSQVTDLSPLQGMPLTMLNLNSCSQVTDLSPLKGMSLTTLNIISCNVHDLAPLQGMSLTEVWIDPRLSNEELDVLRKMKSLKIIVYGKNPGENAPAPQFWKRYDIGEFKK